MLPTARLLKSHVTLYTKPLCGLCVTAKNSLSRAWDIAPDDKKFDYSEVDITKKGNEQWWDLYAMDVPVVHVQNSDRTIKFMHHIEPSHIVRELERE